MTDAELQNQIDKAYLIFDGLAKQRRGLKPGAKRDKLSAAVEAAWQKVERLIKQRSPVAVRRMERDKGLSRQP